MNRRTFLGMAAGVPWLAAELPSLGATPNRARLALAAEIRADADARDVLARAKALLATGLNAGDGYGEVWIRDLNTFLELAVSVTDPERLRAALVTFFQFQGDGGDIVDGYIPQAKASVGYQYRHSALAPALLAHKNTVETDQETSLVQALAKYCRDTGNWSILAERVAGETVLDRLERALEYLLRERYDRRTRLLWGATTVDWGDVQPEHEWGVELDANSHRCIDIYDNAMFVVAVNDFIALNPADRERRRRWGAIRDAFRRRIRQRLWDARRGKFIPHLYLAGSPFPADFDEAAIWYHGGTAVAIEAGILSLAEVRASLAAVRENVRSAGASSIGLTVYPPYPDGMFRNPGMRAWSYQNGGDWCWFGGRWVQQLFRLDLAEEAWTELRPMLRRVRERNGFFEWWTRDNQPKGSGQFRGSAGVLGKAILMAYAWADQVTSKA